MDLIYRYDPFQPIIVNRPTSAEEAVQALVDGNRRLVDLVARMQAATLGEEGANEAIIPISPITLGVPFFPGAVLDQEPFAMVLGCSDARVPLESVFDKSFNEMFVVRIAGNVLGTECLGSFTYAARNLGRNLKTMVVLGHTGCGAVTAAVNTYLEPNEYADVGFTYALRSLVDRVMIAVRGAAKAIARCCGDKIESHPNYRAALIDAAVFLNAAITAFDVRNEIGTVTNKKLPVYYGVCDLQTMMVTSTPVTPTTTTGDLRPAPHDASAFHELGRELVEVLIAKGLLS